MGVPARQSRSAPFGASVDALARRHFGGAVDALAPAAERLVDVERRMLALAAEYKALFAPSGLALYVRRCRAEVRPQGLYWGRVFDFVMPDGTVKKYRWHLRMRRLTSHAIYAYARRWDDLEARELLRDFDRRRRELNGGHARLAVPLARLRRRLTLRIPRGRETAAAHPAVAAPFAIRNGDALLDGLWRVAWACASTEAEMLRLVLEGRAKLPPWRLFPYAATGEDGFTAVGWAAPARVLRDGRWRAGRRHLSNRLSRAKLRLLGVPGSLWPPFLAFDLAVRPLRREHARYAGRLGIVKRVGRRLAKGGLCR